MTWTMSGKNNFIGRAICMFMNMDKMIGPNFEEGMTGIKQIVEGHPPGERRLEIDR
jgi:hypothetical protein